ncbi:synaptosomal-associated protein 29 [Tribolium castaneum]|uniref:Synaptosomal-associated protein 29-like Protein n=1 Tax=Tribolium castaneum TaxID=7070 RepID=A0A139WGW0_TRICA|nr:PREDICTED: synaptosomal-associated protein 29 [Tribolium castaneum]KYB27129.1 Synaptosomal-associated protein 29-like Protein [Tribolium castaneum]|eukprot:XP_001814545.1 PREDICTED: synaptosomal-associated protein 29 [Tribolium castaneum]
MSNPYARSTNPFENDDDVDDELFLRNSRRSQGGPQASFDDQLQSFQERKRAIEDRTINSTEKSLSILRDSEQIGIATAEELMRQREKLEKTDKQLDEINATLRFSQKHINGIKSVFNSLKNYMAGKNDASPSPPSKTTKSESEDLHKEFEQKLSTYDRFENHPSTRLKNLDYNNAGQTSGSKDFSAKLDANLQEMCSNISRLKNLATDLSFEIDSQNDLISTITDKAETADMTITKQNKDMMRILKKS